jgi:TRAP-type mannitol/chloroaromatic compound transport system substrate-binding protein
LTGGAEARTNRAFSRRRQDRSRERRRAKLNDDGEFGEDALRSCLLIGLSALVAIASVLGARPAWPEPTRIEVASMFPAAMPLLGADAHRLDRQVERLSAGALQLVFHDPDALVPAAETVDAVADGRVDAAWAGAGWFAARDSAFAMFSAVPFGPEAGEYLAWMYHGGGLELARELFHAHAIHNIPCAILPPEASGWFRKEIRSVDDLRGMTMRVFGMGAKVLARFGVATQQLPPAAILPALQAGALDAAEFSLPSIDLPLGFDQVTAYYYFPGWHQQATFFDLYVNLARWRTLAPQHRAILEVACGDSLRATIAAGEAGQWQALDQLQRRGVQLKRWPAEILVAFEDAWHEIVAEESAANPNFHRVYASYAQFRSDYRIWRYLSYLQ